MTNECYFLVPLEKGCSRGPPERAHLVSLLCKSRAAADPRKSLAQAPPWRLSSSTTLGHMHQGQEKSQNNHPESFGASERRLRTRATLTCTKTHEKYEKLIKQTTRIIICYTIKIIGGKSKNFFNTRYPFHKFCRWSWVE